MRYVIEKARELVVINYYLPRGRKIHSLLNKNLSLVQLWTLEIVPLVVTKTEISVNCFMTGSMKIVFSLLLIDLKKNNYFSKSKGLDQKGN